MNNYEAEAMAEAIKNMEPALRTKGETPDWLRFRQQFQMGMFAEESSIQSAIENSRADKVEWNGQTVLPQPER